ncbi:MAG: hypothetical protein GY805_16460, partial [Chloroflexi bacterium]|nr:hypothetical protein [Chloroflexota bacterium]
MAQLRLFLFGTPRVERDDIEISISYRKAQALLYYLAITQRQHNRIILAELLSSDGESTNALADLRRLLYSLKKAIGSRWVKASSDAIGIDGFRDIQVDVNHFRHFLASCRSHQHDTKGVCSVCLNLLTEAVELYNEDFLR